jgi:hypothetical protein
MRRAVLEPTAAFGAAAFDARRASCHWGTLSAQRVALIGSPALLEPRDGRASSVSMEFRAPSGVSDPHGHRLMSYAVDRAVSARASDSDAQR